MHVYATTSSRRMLWFTELGFSVTESSLNFGYGDVEVSIGHSRKFPSYKHF